MAKTTEEWMAAVSELMTEIPEGLDMSAMEKATEELKERVGEATLAKLLARLPDEGRDPKACPRCGRKVGARAKDRRREVRTMSGSQVVLRNYHYCKKCKHGFYPRDRELGLPEEGEVTHEVEKRILDVGVNDTYDHAAARWGVHYRTPISSNLIRRVIDRVGARCNESNPQDIQQELLPRQQEDAPDLLIVQTDGSFLPMRGDEPWKEAKVAVIARGDRYLSHREARRGQLAEARYLAVVGSVAEFERALEVALRVEKAKQASALVWLGDGAAWNWNLSRSLVCEAIEILDWYHAVEHAMDCGKILLREDPILLPLWKRRAENLLIAGNIDALIGELMDCLEDVTDADVHAINALVRYYRTNQTRMRYDEYLARGLPIGSGIVESAHRHVLQERMKRAGQHWSLPRARTMANLRAALRTAGPCRFHDAILAARRTRDLRPPEKDRGSRTPTKLIHPGLRNRIRASNR